MNTGKPVFAQIMEHLPLTTFRRCVARYGGGEHQVKTFSCLDQYLCKETSSFANMHSRVWSSSTDWIEPAIS